MINETFRDRISTVNEEGNRVRIYPRKPKGVFYNYRIITSIILIALLVGIPFISINGRPFFLFDILQRRFYLFGVGFWPQDFHIFLLIMISLLLFIILFTVVFGRLWCGWVCPQTVFMEMVARKIEYWIEGDVQQQKKLNEQSWNIEKLGKKLLKHSLFIFLAWFITNILLAWVIGPNALFTIMTEPIAEHTGGFVAMLSFTGFLYWVFASFREQICTLVCPYGRLQSVLVHDKTIAVHYDFVRGEPRHKKPVEGGDCIDCHQCVHVCPTGIDIRNGTQLECINCTACMDACDTVMTKVKKPKGLIKYASFHGIKNGEENILNARTIGYSFVLLILLSIATFFIGTRNPIEATVLRTPGSTFLKTKDDHISNLFNAQFVNKTFDLIEPEILLASPKEGEIQFVTPTLNVEPEALLQTAFFVHLPENFPQSTVTPVQFDILVEGEIIQKVRSSFISPGKQ